MLQQNRTKIRQSVRGGAVCQSHCDKKNWTLQTGDESWSQKVWNNSVQLDGQLNKVCLCESVASVCRYLWQRTTGPCSSWRFTASASVSAGHGLVTGNSSDWKTNGNFLISVHASKLYPRMFDRINSRKIVRLVTESLQNELPVSSLEPTVRDRR